MGRIKTTPIKRASRKLFAEHKAKITTDFEHNKSLLPDFADIKNKKMRNSIAGYLVRLKKVELQQQPLQQPKL